MQVKVCSAPRQTPSQSHAVLQTTGVLFAWPATFLHGKAAAAGSALINSMGGVGGFVGPTLIGFLVDDNDADDYDAAMLAVGICVMCGAVLMLGKCSTQRSLPANVMANRYVAQLFAE